MSHLHPLAPPPTHCAQVTQLLGRPLNRQPAPLTRLEALEGGWGLSITAPPEPRGAKGHLAFVAARLALDGCPAGSSSSGGSGEASPAISKRLHEVLATVAMQFGGYMFRLSESQVRVGGRGRLWIECGTAPACMRPPRAGRR